MDDMSDWLSLYRGNLGRMLALLARKENMEYS